MLVCAALRCSGPSLCFLAGLAVLVAAAAIIGGKWGLTALLPRLLAFIRLLYYLHALQLDACQPQGGYQSVSLLAECLGRL